MAVVHTDQRRPFTVEEAGDTDALPSRLYKRLAHNANNLITFVIRPVLVAQHWPDGIVTSATGAETYMAEWPLRVVPRFYREIRFVVGAFQTAGTGAGADNVTLYLRAYRQLHRGGVTGVRIAVGSVTVDQGAGAPGHRQIAGTLDVSGRLGRSVYLVLSSLSNNGTAAARVHTLKAWARVGA